MSRSSTYIGGETAEASLEARELGQLISAYVRALPTRHQVHAMGNSDEHVFWDALDKLLGL